MGNLLNRRKQAQTPTPVLAIFKRQLFGSQSRPFDYQPLFDEDEEFQDDEDGTKKAVEEGQTNEDQPESKKTEENLSPDMEALLRRRPGYAYFTTVDFVFVRGKPIGMTLSNRRRHQVIVTALKPGGITIEKLQLLDRCLAVNDQPVFNKYMAKRLIVNSWVKFNLTIERPLTDEARKEFQEEHEEAGAATSVGNDPPVAAEGNKTAEGNISPRMEALLWRGTGYEYFTVNFDWESTPNKPLGMDLKNSRRRVIVTELKPGGIAVDKLRPFDRILAVNDQLVFDAFLANGLILRETRGKFNLTIERPIANEAKKSFQKFDKNQYVNYVTSMSQLNNFW